MNTLPVSRLVNVSVSLSPQAVVGRNFGNLLILGDSNVISGLQRIQSFSSITAVGQSFGSTAPEFLAAELYFGQSPQPTSLSIGRWLRTATAAQLQGAILTAAQSNLALFTAITSGGFDITIDGSAIVITGLNFSAATNLNGVASDITTVLSGAGTCVWNGSQFVIISATTGAGIPASATATFSAAPTAADTITINGLAITFVAASPTGNQVLIGSSAATSATNLNTFLQGSSNADLTVLNFSVSGAVVTIASKSVGTAGNSIAISKSSTAITLSSSTLSGGTNASSVSYATSPASGQDVSSLLGFTSVLALPLVPGYAAESALQAVVALDAISNAWYGLTFAASVMPSDSDYEAIAPFIEADSVTRMFGITIQNTNVLSSEVTNDLASILIAQGYEQTFSEYCSSNPYAVASPFGRLFTVDFTAANTAIDLMYKQLPGITGESLTDQQANTLQSKRVNVFADYDNGTEIFQYGTMAGPVFVDETYNIDWFQNACQVALFNVNYTSTTKIPQTDQGMNQYTNAIATVCEQAVNNGVAAPGIWNSAGFGSLQQGQFLKTGYYIYAPPVALQSESDRAARKSVAFQVAVKFAGSTQTVDLLVTFNR